MKRRSYALSTWIFLRGLGLTYLIAWLSFWVQMQGLVGDRGIVPASELLGYLRDHPQVGGFFDYPTLAWLGASTGALHLLCAAGTVCSVLLLVGLVPGPALLGCWATYLSIVTIGRPFMAFQWDALLLEAGFTALLVAPWAWRSRARSAPEPVPFARWLVYLLLFKLMFSSGVVKLASGDPAWRDLSALTYHFWTQPLPHVGAYFANRLPGWVLAGGTATMLGIELVVPWLVWFPGWPRTVACAAIVALMGVIGATGNYGFFNALAVVLCVPLLDDVTCSKLLPRPVRARLARRPAAARPARAPWKRRTVAAAGAVVLVLGGGQLLLTVTRAAPAEVVRDVVAKVAPFDTFNRYGLFAVMTKERPEIVIEGSNDGQNWKAYPFAFKPTDPTDPPRFAGPHMPRLDWQMWFAALGGLRRNTWVLRFMERLAENDPAVIDLLDEDAIPFDRPPAYLRARLYHYTFTDPATLRATGRWWDRKLVGPYTPVFRTDSLARRRN